VLVEQNQAIVLQFYKAFDDPGIDDALELLAPTFVAHVAGTSEPLNANRFKQFGLVFNATIGDRFLTRSCAPSAPAQKSATKILKGWHSESKR